MHKNPQIKWGVINFYRKVNSHIDCKSKQKLLCVCKLKSSESITYTAAHMYPSAGCEYFVKSGFEWEPLMLDKQMVPHFDILDVGFKISQE